MTNYNYIRKYIIKVIKVTIAIYVDGRNKRHRA